jgi:hypothetical protein
MALRTQIRLPGLTGPRIDKLRTAMSGPGFALLDTPPFFDDGLLRRLRRRRTVLLSDDKRWMRFPQLARYTCWLETLLAEALPEEAVSLTTLEYRHELAFSVDHEVDRLHADGSYIRTVYTLFGAGTIYREGRVERPVPHRQTLLMTAMDRARAIGLPCTLHLRPGAGPERAVLVGSFEPDKAQSLPSCPYRQAVVRDDCEVVHAEAG